MLLGGESARAPAGRGLWAQRRTRVGRAPQIWHPGKRGAPEGVMGSRLPAVGEHRYLLR